MENKRIIFLYPATQDIVRIQKFAEFFYKKGIKQDFIGWKRYPEKIYSDVKFQNVSYVVHGGGEGKSYLPILYIWFIIKLFWTLLFLKTNREKVVFFAVNFETALVARIISRIRGIPYIYDIWDELSKSHNFPGVIVNLLNHLDKKNRASSSFYIHVDENRFSIIDNGLDNSIVVYNSPYDFKLRNSIHNGYSNSFAVTGWLNNTRGLASIFLFAKDHPTISFIIVGEFIDSHIENGFLSLDNVHYYHFMPQEQLFSIIVGCRGIFSLYDPSIEINRLAASNKLYDSMMLSIPVIVNNGILASSFVETNQIGYVVNYDYDSTWDVLIDYDLGLIEKYGSNGRKLYMEKYEFADLLEKRVYPKLTKLLT
jgi:hypothetical protein